RCAVLPVGIFPRARHPVHTRIRSGAQHPGRRTRADEAARPAPARVRARAAGGLRRAQVPRTCAGRIEADVDRSVVPWNRIGRQVAGRARTPREGGGRAARSSGNERDTARSDRALSPGRVRRGRRVQRRTVRASLVREAPVSCRQSPPMSKDTTVSPVIIRTSLTPGDVGSVVRLHGVLYAKEYGFDHTFEAYVAAPLAKFVQSPGPNERIWLAERNRALVGCVAIVASTPEIAQLRWFIVDPECRGAGIGKRLLFEAIEFSRARGYRSIILWTVSGLPAAAHLYRSA